MMGRFKHGQKRKRKDLWQEAGGRGNVIQCIISHRFGENVTPQQRSSVTLPLFKEDTQKKTSEVVEGDLAA